MKYIFSNLSVSATCLRLFHSDETKLHPLDFAPVVVTDEAQPVNGPPHTEDQASVGRLTLQLLHA